MPIRGSVMSLGSSNSVCDCSATQSMIAETSRASKSSESKCRMPPDANSPRGSQVTTLYPAARSLARPGTNPKTVVSCVGSV